MPRIEAATSANHKLAVITITIFSLFQMATLKVPMSVCWGEIAMSLKYR